MHLIKDADVLDLSENAGIVYIYPVMIPGVLKATALVCYKMI